MKPTINQFIIAVIMLITWSACKKDDPEMPTVLTSQVSAITLTTATCGGNITLNGGAEIIARGVCWSTNQYPSISDNKTTDGAGTGLFSSELNDLTPNTIYYVRAYATNKVGTSYGTEVRFTSNAPTLPTITTVPATDISYKEARLGVSVTSDGGASISECGICYSTNENPTVANNKVSLSSGVGTSTSEISSFQANTKYYVRAYAINSVGTVYGEQISFITLAPVAPSIGHFFIQNITLTKAIADISVNNDGGSDIIERGVCYSSMMINPTTSNAKVVSAGTTGEFTCNISGLAHNTTYHARAFATNAIGTTYSFDIQFRTSATTINDVDGNAYDVIEVGNQAWLKQNLKTTKYRNNESIGTTTLDITNDATPKYQWPATGFESNAFTFGRLYTWYAITDSRGICPDGWHVANTNEWTELTDFLGGESIAGGKLKSFSNWSSPNTGASDEVGFSAVGSGIRNINGTYQGFDTNCVWWSVSPEASSTNAWAREIFNSSATISTLEKSKKMGYSVRCIKN
jgi:uncharacterized protein (TIGR02145 family)